MDSDVSETRRLETLNSGEHLYSSVEIRNQNYDTET